MGGVRKLQHLLTYVIVDPIQVQGKEGGGGDAALFDALVNLEWWGGAGVRCKHVCGNPTVEQEQLTDSPCINVLALHE